MVTWLDPAANGTDSLLFSDDMTADSGRMDSEAYERFISVPAGCHKIYCMPLHLASI